MHFLSFMHFEEILKELTFLNKYISSEKIVNIQYVQEVVTHFR